MSSSKLSKNLRIITNGEKALVYNAFFGKGMICHKDMLELIDNIQQGRSINEIKKIWPQDNLEVALRSLKEKGLVVENGYCESNEPYQVYTREDIHSGSLINKLRLNVTLTCNMRCAYCYVETKGKDNNQAMMKWPIAKKALDKFFALQKEHSHSFSIVRFFGGEPLLNWPLIAQCLDHNIEGIKNGIEINYILNTNGTVFSEEMAKKLSANKVRLAVSIDGIQNDHDRFRKFKSGNGTFTMIKANVERFLTQGCNVGIETTVGDHNILGLKGLVNLIAQLNDTYGVKIPLGFQHLTIVPKNGLDTTTIEEKVDRLIALFDYARQKGVQANTGMVHFPLNALMGQRSIGVYCRAMGGELCIYPNGDVYPCGALNFKLGKINDIKSVFKSTAYHKLINRVAGNIPGCRGCEIEAFCAGGCAADAFNANDAINTPTRNCDLERSFFKELVKRDILPSVDFS